MWREGSRAKRAVVVEALCQACFAINGNYIIYEWGIEGRLAQLQMVPFKEVKQILRNKISIQFHLTTFE